MLRTRQIVTLASLSALAPIALDMYLPAAVEMAEALGASAREATYSVSIFLIGIAAGQLVAGPLSDRFGRRPMIIWGLILFIIASLIASYTSSFAILLGARLLQALGACSVLNSCRAVVRDKMDASGAAKVFSQMALVGGLAPIMAPIMGAWLTHVGTWRLNFVVMGMLSTGMLLASIALLAESRSDDTAANARGENPLRAYWELTKNPRLRLYLLTAACNSAGFFTYIANSPSIFVDVFGLSPTQYSLVFACNAAALVTATQINRFMLSRHSLDGVLRKSGRNALLLATGFVLFAVTGIGGLPVFSLLLFLMVGSVSPVQANTMAGGLSVDGLRAGSAAALFGATTFAAGAITSWVGGLIYDRSERPLCFLLAACLVCAAAAIYRLPRAAKSMAA